MKSTRLVREYVYDEGEHIVNTEIPCLLLDDPFLIKQPSYAITPQCYHFSNDPGKHNHITVTIKMKEYNLERSVFT